PTSRNTTWGRDMADIGIESMVSRAKRERGDTMAKKEDFSADEWKALRTGMLGAGIYVSLSDRDLSDTFGEAGALAKYLQGQQMAGSTELVRALAHEHGNPFGLTASPDRVRDETLQSLKSAAATLTAKAADDLGGYRDLVLGLATAVAQAKSGESA